MDKSITLAEQIRVLAITLRTADEYEISLAAETAFEGNGIDGLEHLSQLFAHVAETAREVEADMIAEAKHEAACERDPRGTEGF